MMWGMVMVEVILIGKKNSKHGENWEVMLQIINKSLLNSA